MSSSGGHPSPARPGHQSSASPMTPNMGVNRTMFRRSSSVITGSAVASSPEATKHKRVSAALAKIGMLDEEDQKFVSPPTPPHPMTSSSSSSSRFPPSRIIMLLSFPVVALYYFSYLWFPSPTHVLTCNKSNTQCTVQFYSYFTGTMVHEAKLERETHSLFSRDLMVNGQPYRRHLDNDKHAMFHTSKDSSDAWGTSVIDLHSKTLLNGVFCTGGKDHNEIIEHNILANNHARRILGEDNHEVLPLPEDQQFSAPIVNFKFSEVPQARMEELVNTIIPFFPNCFPNDQVTHVFKMNIIYDNGLFESVAGPEFSVEQALQDVDVLFSVGKLIFLAQLNIRLEVGSVRFGSRTDPMPLSQTKGKCLGAQGASKELLAWNKLNSPDSTGFTLFLSDCFQGITGVSYLGNACNAGGMNANVAAHSWLVAFHELGHAFSMYHSFENGRGLTGGLMDYGSGLYNGVAQFHPNKRTEVCPFLSRLEGNCPFFTIASGGNSACGDGILSADEQCECLDSSKNCGLCKNCQVPKWVTCSAAQFLFRTKSMPAIVVVADESYRANKACCLNNILAPPKTLCGTDLLEMCNGPNGQCEQICTKYLEWNNPNCGFDATGCRVGCLYKNKCRYDMEIMNDDGSFGYLNNMKDGTPCFTAIGNKPGTCQEATAECQELPTSPPTLDLAPIMEEPGEATPAPNVEINCALLRSQTRCRSLTTICKWSSGKCSALGFKQSKAQGIEAEEEVEDDGEDDSLVLEEVDDTGFVQEKAS